MSDFNVGFVIFPDITQLDFTGPFEVLSRLATPPSISVPSVFAHLRTHIVAKAMQQGFGRQIAATDCSFHRGRPAGRRPVPRQDQVKQRRALRRTPTVAARLR